MRHNGGDEFVRRCNELRLYIDPDHLGCAMFGHQQQIHTPQA
jgi:hypothetical protein